MTACFVRGRGRGHALTALRLARRLPTPSSFVSYGTGARTLREHGVAVDDLRLPDDPDLFAVRARAGKWLARHRPAQVFAFEEFEALEAAAAAGLPSVAITDWFLPDAADWRMRSLALARQVWLLDNPGIYPEPDYLCDTVKYLGPILRPLPFQTRSRHAARRQLGLAPDDFVVAVFVYPGRRSERRAPLRATLTAALAALPKPGRKLILWNRDGDVEFSRTMRAADVGITKGNRNLVLEMGAMGLPAITVDYGLNLIDSYRVKQCEWNQTIAAANLTIDTMATALRLAR